MTWNREELAGKNIFYDEDDIRPRAIPARLFPSHVEALREAMLDFSFPALGYRDEENTTAAHGKRATDPALMPADHIQNEAINIYKGGYAEKKWESFYKGQFFDPLKKSISVSRENSRRISRSNYFYDDFQMDSNRVWDMFSDKADDISELYSYERAKCPKPDCAFHLPLYHLGNEPKIPKIVDSRAQQWNQAASLSSLVETFSWSVHKELFEYGLRSTPIRALHKEPVDARLISYPWLIVEHKKEGVALTEKETVCCQAANGSACAIQMNRVAARYAVKQNDHEEIPPIPTITTIGKDVKVWITYFGKDFWIVTGNRYTISKKWVYRKQGYVMRAIWEGDMTKLEDIIHLQLILDNTHTWAMREYKPLMSTYINQWSHIHCRSGIDSANTALVQRQQLTERCQQIVPVVQGILETHSSIELDYSKHSMMTPLLLSLLVKEILSSERQSMVKSLETTISKMLHEKGLSPGETDNGTQTSAQDHQRESVQTQETIFSQIKAFDVGNMDDDDCRERGSNKKPRTVPITSPNSDECRRSSRLNPQLSSQASSASEGSTRLGSTGQSTQDLETPRTDASSQPPATPCSSSAVNASTDDDANQKNPRTSSSRIATPVDRSRERSVLDEAASTPRPFSFTYPKEKIFELEGSSPSPEPVKIDWTVGWAARYGDVSWDFGPVSPLPFRSRRARRVRTNAKSNALP